MNSFLYRVAELYYQHHSQDISEYTFVFPNRRAGIFFQRYLAEIAQKPLFSPEIITINECFSSACQWQPADKVSMLFRLYRIYREVSRSDESFDSFAFWGEMLLSDFNEVDKYRVDARQLFTNITELKEIDKLFNIFSENQVQAIRQFWSNFVPVAEGKTQEDFIATWKILYPVYEQFRNELIAENTATEGMICREVTDKLVAKQDISEWNDKKFVFIGFNALNPCERTLLIELKKRSQADFYWDYESNEVRDTNNNASLFYAENIHLFPSKYELKAIAEPLNNINFELIAVPSAVGQTKQILELLNQLYPQDVDNFSWIKTAIILPDENFLLPLLHSIPNQIEKVNVTMGFPLKATPVSGLIDQIFELQRRARMQHNGTYFYHQNVTNILNHQYINILSSSNKKKIGTEMAVNNWIYIDASYLQQDDLLSAIFCPQSNANDFLSYLLNILRKLQDGWKAAAETHYEYRLERDFIFQYYITINRLSDIINQFNTQIELNIDTLTRLTKQLVSSITIPFIGEPLDGLQVMGVLETRGLDFENLIITSFNEGIFPQKSFSNSFIPYNLRRGFNLPTYEQQDAITAYNFYRLIHRAKRIFFLYDSRTEGMQSGEVSRFIHQLQYHYGISVKRKNITFDIGFNDAATIQIEKSPTVIEKLERFCAEGEGAKSLSASSINSYINCPMQFYLTRVEEMEETTEIKETIEENVFGSIFHAVMENIYSIFTNKTVNRIDIQNIIDNKLLIDTEISRAFSIHFFKKDKDSIVKLEGNNLLIANVIKKYILQILEKEKEITPFKYIGSEIRKKISLPLFDGKKSVNIKGFIDRVDETNGIIRIIDYKTGKGTLDFKELSDAFDKNADKPSSFILQTMLYGLLYKEDAAGKQMMPGIYFMRNIFNTTFNTHLTQKNGSDIQIVNDFYVYEDEFKMLLTSCLEDIFNPEIPFTQTTNAKHCEYCSFKTICNRS